MGKENNEITNNNPQRSHIQCSEFYKNKEKNKSNIFKVLSTEQEERENNCKITLEEEKEKPEFVNIEQLL